jgi:hypothetical protein
MSTFHFLFTSSDDALQKYQKIRTLEDQRKTLTELLISEKKALLQKAREVLFTGEGDVFAPLLTVPIKGEIIKGDKTLADLIIETLSEDSLFFGTSASIGVPFNIETKVLVLIGIKNKEDLEKVLERLKLVQERDGIGFSVEIINTEEEYEKILFRLNLYAPKVE